MEKVSCIPNNKEQYISFSKHNILDPYNKKYGQEVYSKFELRFIDSFNSMASPFAILAGNLKTEDIKLLNKYYSKEKLKLLTRKGVYTYDYVDSVEKLKERKLPPKEAFYSIMSTYPIRIMNMPNTLTFGLLSTVKQCKIIMICI